MSREKATRQLELVNRDRSGGESEQRIKDGKGVLSSYSIASDIRSIYRTSGNIIARNLSKWNI